MKTERTVIVTLFVIGETTTLTWILPRFENFRNVKI